MRELFLIAAIAVPVGFFWTVVGLDLAREYKNPPGPCSVLDYRRCGR